MNSFGHYNLLVKILYFDSSEYNKLQVKFNFWPSNVKGLVYSDENNTVSFPVMGPGVSVS